MALADIFSHKKSVDDYLTLVLTEKKSTFSAINSWGTESLTRLLPYITAGKGVRGCLAMYSYTMFNHGTNTHEALPIAAGLECIHAGALIHDDIMDQDDKRRHQKAMHKQFVEFSNDARFGESMAINVGDMCFFLGFEQFSRLTSSNATRIISLASREFTTVTVAQQFDVASSYLSHQSSQEEIISLYKTKTARYTFSLPLMIGALLADADEQTLKILETMGESMGILFQIRDDELSIIGDTNKTGKPIGSDETNHKQTLISLYLKEENATDYTTSRTHDRIQAVKKLYENNVHIAINALPVESIHKQTLTKLVQFCGAREA